MRHLNRKLALMILLFTLVPSKAQSNLFDLEGACQMFAPDLCAWITYASDLAASVRDLIGNFHQEFVQFGEELFSNWLKDALSTVSIGVDAQALEAAFAGFEEIVRRGPSAVRDEIRRVVNNLTLLRLTNQNAPQYSPDWWYEQAISANPNLLAAELASSTQEGQAAAAKIEAAAVHDLNVKLGATLAESTATQDAMAKVLNPSIGGVGGGDAAQLEDAVRTATSTRAAIQVLTEGIADLMRHEAVFSGNLQETLKVLAQQQVMTTWELQLAVQTLVEQREEEIAVARAELQARINQEYEAGEQLGSALEGLVGSTLPLLRPDVSHLNMEALGW